MTVKSAKNQYRGINAHLHSFLQGENKWNRFHNASIEHLTHALNVQLRPMGYVAEAEESMQVRRLNERRIPRSDVTIYDTNPQRATQYPTSRTLQFTLEELLDEPEFEHRYLAIGIYERLPDDVSGDQVAWIEVLSPSNKGDHADAHAYQGKRWILMESGVVVVEIDFLHETPPTFERLPDYTDPNQRDSAYPYRILVKDPRPTLRHGTANIVGILADQAIPLIRIPLRGEDSIQVDMQSVYDFMFEYKFYGDSVDYLSLPQHFDLYSSADQARILSRMVAVCEAFQRGDTLEAPLDDVTVLSVEEALERLEVLRSSH